LLANSLIGGAAINQVIENLQTDYLLILNQAQGSPWAKPRSGAVGQSCRSNCRRINLCGFL
jgi:hypothetical protein